MTSNLKDNWELKEARMRQLADGSDPAAAEGKCNMHKAHTDQPGWWGVVQNAAPGMTGMAMAIERKSIQFT